MNLKTASTPVLKSKSKKNLNLMNKTSTANYLINIREKLSLTKNALYLTDHLPSISIEYKLRSRNRVPSLPSREISNTLQVIKTYEYRDFSQELMKL